ncbi:MAG: class I SAM-dependent methyltransferase [Pseudomonadota bacterium]
MRWLIKAALQKALSACPAGAALNYYLQRYVSHGLPRGRGELAEKFNNAVTHYQAARRWGGLGRGPVSAYEFGTGWELAVPMCLYLLGVREQALVDLRPLVRWELLADAWQKLAGIAAEAGPAAMAAGHPLADLDGPPPKGLAELRQRLGIVYHAPCDARMTGLPAGRFELVHSTEVLEHIPQKDLAPILRECGRLLAPGGVVSLQVDMQDHYSYFDAGLSAFNYLRFGDRAWSLINSGLHYQNRLRLPDYLRAVAEAGLRLVHQQVTWPSPADLELLRRLPLAEPYRDMDSRELGARSALLVCRAD